MAVPEAGRSTRGLALAVACLVLAGVVSAGVRAADGERPGRAVVSAAGDQSGTVDVTSTVTVTLPDQSSTPSTVATTTTLPKAAVDVLNAIAGSTTTTRRPATTATTRPPTPTTTVPTPTTAPTPSTTAPAQFTATLVNAHSRAVALVVNRRPFSLAPGQSLTEVLPISSRGDLVQVRLAEDDDCGRSDSGVGIFKPGGMYRVTIEESGDMCEGFAARIPLLRIGPA